MTVVYNCLVPQRLLTTGARKLEVKLAAGHAQQRFTKKNFLPSALLRQLFSENATLITKLYLLFETRLGHQSRILILDQHQTTSGS